MGRPSIRSEAIERAGNRCSSITFDDGYRDNVTVALPILREAGCRATLYPTLEAIVEGRPPGRIASPGSHAISLARAWKNRMKLNSSQNS